MVIVGQSLLQPESGWTRVDSDNTNFFKYSSGWSRYVHSASYGGAYHYTSNSSGYCTFKFTGTDLRLIVRYGDSTYTNKAYLKIDGVSYSPFTIQAPGAMVNCALACEINGLSNKEHTVELRVSAGAGGLNLDAIDYRISKSPHYLLKSTDGIYTIANGELQKLEENNSDKTVLFSQGFTVLTKENCEIIAQELGKCKILRAKI